MATYRFNRTEFARMMKSPMVDRFMRKSGNEAADDLRATAPRRTGRYAASIRVEAGVDRLRRDRAAVFVIADNDHARLLEVGSRTNKNPPRPLGKLLDRIRE
jgi:hypothetical protein